MQTRSQKDIVAMDISSIVVGTESALKLRAVRKVCAEFGLRAEVSPCAVGSGVGIQPSGIRIIKKGAHTRAQNAKKAHPADLALGIESGLVQEMDYWFTVVCAVAIPQEGPHSASLSALFPIPEWVVGYLFKHHTELGVVAQKLARGGEKDATSYFSEGFLPRERLVEQALQCALMPILHRARYRAGEGMSGAEIEALFNA